MGRVGVVNAREFRWQSLLLSALALAVLLVDIVVVEDLGIPVRESDVLDSYKVLSSFATEGANGIKVT